MVLGMRWDGNDGDQGYPKTFGYPVWFIIPGALNIRIMQAIIGHPKSNDYKVAEVLLSILPKKN